VEQIADHSEHYLSTGLRNSTVHAARHIWVQGS